MRRGLRPVGGARGLRGRAGVGCGYGAAAAPRRQGGRARHPAPSCAAVCGRQCRYPPRAVCKKILVARPAWQAAVDGAKKRLPDRPAVVRAAAPSGTAAAQAGPARPHLRERSRCLPSGRACGPAGRVPTLLGFVGLDSHEPSSQGSSQETRARAGRRNAGSRRARPGAQDRLPLDASRLEVPRAASLARPGAQDRPHHRWPRAWEQRHSARIYRLPTASSCQALRRESARLAGNAPPGAAAGAPTGLAPAMLPRTTGKWPPHGPGPALCAGRIACWRCAERAAGPMPLRPDWRAPRCRLRLFMARHWRGGT